MGLSRHLIHRAISDVGSTRAIQPAASAGSPVLGRPCGGPGFEYACARELRTGQRRCVSLNEWHCRSRIPSPRTLGPGLSLRSTPTQAALSRSRSWPQRHATTDKIITPHDREAPKVVREAGDETFTTTPTRSDERAQPPEVSPDSGGSRHPCGGRPCCGLCSSTPRRSW